MGRFSYLEKLKGKRRFIQSKIMAFLGNLIGSLLPRERAKAIRHAERAGAKTAEDFDQYMIDKHGEKAAAKGMEVSDYLKEQQARRKEKYGKGGKTQANRGDSEDSSEDSEG